MALFLRWFNLAPPEEGEEVEEKVQALVQAIDGGDISRTNPQTLNPKPQQHDCPFGHRLKTLYSKPQTIN